VVKRRRVLAVFVEVKLVVVRREEVSLREVNIKKDFEEQASFALLRNLFCMTLLAPRTCRMMMQFSTRKSWRTAGF